MSEKWKKYILSTGPCTTTIDRTFSEHRESMGGYQPDDAYQSEEALFKKYLFDNERFLNYAYFLEGHIKKDDRVLSIASGRCINELFLISRGYHIVCSDLDYPDCYPATRRLFPGFQFLVHDILKSPVTGRYDGIIVLSLIYLFDDRELDAFFRNAGSGLADGGYLILDSSGSAPGILSSLFHHGWLPVEAHIMRIVKTLAEKKDYCVSRKEFGYRRSDAEIESVAKKNGFVLVKREDYGFSMDLNRGHVIPYLVKRTGWAKPLLSFIGKGMPYQRMFFFRKYPPGG